MNKDALLRVADAIEKHEIEDLGFNMNRFVTSSAHDQSGHYCGTTACIGGWAIAVQENITGTELLEQQMSSEDRAQKYLELSDDEARTLFLGRPPGTFFCDVTPAQAVATLRYAAKHGVIDWDAANGVGHE